MAEQKPAPPTPASQTEKAPAFKDGKKVGPKESQVQIRPAGAESTANNKPSKWDKVDEESDESFPASDPPGNY